MNREIPKISVAGSPLELSIMDKSKLKGISVDMLLNITFYEGIFNGEALCLIKVKDEKKYTPLRYRRLTHQIEEVTNLPVVLLLDSLPYYARERLISQGVYFIISDKYAFLPTLILNVRAKRNMGIPKRLTPAAQYILIYYLLQKKETVFTISSFEEVVPYNYLAISRAIIVLEETELCKVDIDQTGTKHIYFEKGKKLLWEKSQKYFQSPIKKTVYSNTKPDMDLSISGINALANYTHLNPSKYGSVAVWDRDFEKYINEYNEIEGQYTIEIWRYPTSNPYNQGKYVDKLSLYLSLKDNPDPRVEKELEIMIEELKW